MPNLKKERNGYNIQFLDYLKSFRIVSGLFRQFLDCPNSFQKNQNSSWIVRTVSGLSGKFLDYPDSFWIVWKVSGLSGQFLDCPDSFWIVQTVS